MVVDARPVGVIDAGLGGYTVVRQIQRLMPEENIVYYGDNRNQPYGNREKASILHMARQIFAFMERQNVKLVAVACNTISTLIDEYRHDYGYPIFSIVEAGAQAAVETGARDIGMIGTVFTASSRCYERLILQGNPLATVIGQGCPDLARFIEHGECDQAELEQEVKKEIDAVLFRKSVSHLILGCTHFVYIRDAIHRMYPSLVTIDPAEAQGAILRQHLKETNAVRSGGRGVFRVFTTGNALRYYAATERMTLYPPQSVEQVPAPNPEHTLSYI